MNTKYVQPSKPLPLRDLTTEGTRHAKGLAHAIGMLFQSFDKCRFVKSCLSCDHFREDIEVCNNPKATPQPARPPARIIAFGCQHYDNFDEDIPF